MHLPHGVEPLGELQVVLVLTANHLGNIDILLVALLIECALQEFEVRDEFRLELRVPVDARQRDHSRVDGIEELAENCASSKILDLDQGDLVRKALPAVWC